jgi:manganese oxidase
MTPPKPVSRRSLLSGGLVAGAAAVGARMSRSAAATPTAPAPSSAATGAVPAQPSQIVVPNGAVMPYTVRAGVKIFHLVAEPINHELTTGLHIKAWGYNGRTPGPVIEVTQGDRCRFYVTNKLPEPTSLHWHGIILPNGMDGVAGLTQKSIGPGQTFKYEFTFRHAGTFMYHPHSDEMTQIALGMTGMIVVHPRRPSTAPANAGRRVRDYSFMLHEWKIPIGSDRPDPLAMNDFNVLTFNSKAYPATTPIIAQVGDLVRMRFGNLGPMDHHPIHMHGHVFAITETDGGTVPFSARVPETTVLVPTGSVRVVEFVAAEPGDWPMHCHMTHHAMNQMGHDMANLIGADVRGLDAKLNRVVPGTMVMGQTGMGGMQEMNMAQPRNAVSMAGGQGPFGPIEMGGMFTMIKVRDRIDDDAAAIASWHQAPDGTRAIEATAAELAADGIKI